VELVELVGVLNDGGTIAEPIHWVGPCSTKKVKIISESLSSLKVFTD